jgi:two-component system phosphate regulon sensor histidine kinase PhoR
VEDTGEGIDPKYIPRLTERFFRVDKGRSREQGGTGLGLAIVKHVLARHGAELIITSEPGQGSQFRCHFPADRIIETPPAA